MMRWASHFDDSQLAGQPHADHPFGAHRLPYTLSATMDTKGQTHVENINWTAGL
jgi:hypothetical protein